jgi:small GTP-binding protein
MPANLTPDYLAAEQAYKQAQTQQEKIAALEQMFATLPKHKGTEKMQAEIRRRLSQARKEWQKKGGSHAAPAYLVRSEGAGQVVLIGPPNAGKSLLVGRLTHAKVHVAEYPFTTRLPVPGMMRYEDVQIQLVDTPAISPEFVESWMPQVVRGGNTCVLVVDPSDAGLLEELEFILQRLSEWRLPPPKLLVANKIDLPGAEENYSALLDLYGDRFRSIPLSAATGIGLDVFAKEVFDVLDVVRFYSKPPGKVADLKAPFVIRRGSTVLDAAAQVHRDFAEHLKYARLFRKGQEHGGLMVERAHVVADQDILEFHTA